MYESNAREVAEQCAPFCQTRSLNPREFWNASPQRNNINAYPQSKRDIVQSTFSTPRNAEIRKLDKSEIRKVECA